MESIWIDYNRYLHADVITVPLRLSQLRTIQKGDTILIKGDEGIPDRQATVIDVEGRNIQLEFHDSLGDTSTYA